MDKGHEQNALYVLNHEVDKVKQSDKITSSSFFITII